MLMLYRSLKKICIILVMVVLHNLVKECGSGTKFMCDEAYPRVHYPSNLTDRKSVV